MKVSLASIEKLRLDHDAERGRSGGLRLDGGIFVIVDLRKSGHSTQALA